MTVSGRSERLRSGPPYKAARITSANHGQPVGTGDLVKAFEITPAKELVWSIPGNIAKGNMGNIQILDIPGDLYKFEVLK